MTDDRKGVTRNSLQTPNAGSVIGYPDVGQRPSSEKPNPLGQPSLRAESLMSDLRPWTAVPRRSAPRDDTARDLASATIRPRPARAL